MSKTEWDYSSLADAYVKRPDYSPAAIDRILQEARLREGKRFCDIGAGTGILTRALLARTMSGVAVEPNDAMRAIGLRSTPDVVWIDAVAEDTKQPSRNFDLVTFGSSFNVADRARALLETSRILRPGGWMACLWNHRDLSDPFQAKIEALIGREIPQYNYGTRREDQTDVIASSGLFGSVIQFDGEITHHIPARDWADAWESHSTLERQAGAAFRTIIKKIRFEVDALGRDTLDVPYTTRVWMAQTDK